MQLKNYLAGVFCLLFLINSLALVSASTPIGNYTGNFRAHTSASATTTKFNDSNMKSAATFIAPNNMEIAAVYSGFSTASGQPDAWMRIGLQEGAAEPSGTYIGTSDNYVTIYPTTAVIHGGVLPSTVSLNEGQRYWVVVEQHNGTLNNTHFFLKQQALSFFPFSFSIHSPTETDIGFFIAATNHNDFVWTNLSNRTYSMLLNTTDGNLFGNLYGASFTADNLNGTRIHGLNFTQKNNDFLTKNLTFYTGMPGSGSCLQTTYLLNVSRVLNNTWSDHTLSSCTINITTTGMGYFQRSCELEEEVLLRKDQTYTLVFQGHSCNTSNTLRAVSNAISNSAANILSYQGNKSRVWRSTTNGTTEEILSTEIGFLFYGTVYFPNYALTISNPTYVVASSDDNLTVEFTAAKDDVFLTSDIEVTNITVGGAVCEIVNTTIPATCGGTPSACSTYGTQSPCEGAGCSWTVSSTTTTVVNYTTSQTNWEVPAGVTNITVELWGGGGTGGSTVTNSNVGAGGGAGGMYARSVINVSPGQRLNLTVAASRSHSGSANTNGLAGFNTTVANSTVLVRATGGDFGRSGGNSGTGGTGGTAGGVGQVMYAGGNGGTRPATATSGGGGGGAGSTGAGNNASGQTGGGAKAEHGGAGPNGFSSNSAGAAGGNFGAGGSGSRRNANGGAGAQGLIRITYEQPTYSCTGTPNACTTYEAEGTCTGAGCDWTAEGIAYEVAHLGSGLWQANCTIGPSCTGTNDLFLEINYTVDNILLNTTNVGAVDCSGEGNSCTYSGSGTWNINCAENCAVTSNTNVGGNNIVFSGAGTVTLSAYITNWVVARIQNNCNVRVTSTGGLRD